MLICLVCAEVLPQLTAAGPLDGPIEGGTLITITGQNFEFYLKGGLSCMWDSEETTATVHNNTQITCLTPRHNAGNVSISISPTSSSSRYYLSATQFTYYETIFIGDAAADRVLRFKLKTGSFVDDFVSSRSGGLSKPHGMAFGLDHNFYVASGGTSSVLQYHGQSGQFLKTFCKVEGTPRSLVFHYQDLYVCDSRQGHILRFNGMTGSPRGIYGVHSRLLYPWGIMFEKQTNHSFISDERGGHLVRFKPPSQGLDFTETAHLGTLNFQGRFDKVWTLKSMDLVNSFDFTTDSVYLSSPHANALVRYNRTSGAYITHFEDVELVRPAAIKAHRSVLYVCSNDQIRVYQRITTEFFRTHVSHDHMACMSMIFHESWNPQQGFD